MQIISVKLTLHLTGKCQQKKGKLLGFISWQKPVKLTKYSKNQLISNPYLLQAQPVPVLQLLACYCGSTTMYRQNGNCVNPNHIDS